MKKYVIIGNGVAGATAAENIRKFDREGSITIFSEEPEPFYYRVRLPDVVAGEVSGSGITLRRPEWYATQKMDLLLGETALKVDPSAGTVAGDQGALVSYDALLLAVGARSFIPPVPGSDKEGVFALRTFADAQAIAARAALVDSAVLIGGGLLGLEAGYGLTRRGLKVQVVEFFDRLLPRQMDQAGAAMLRNYLEGKGFSFFLGARSKEILGKGAAEGLALEDGRNLSGGLVLFSAGIRPNLDLAKAMNLEVDRGVKVDDRLKTSREGVFAAGDLIEHRGRAYGIWPAAKDQGAVAGVNMAGGSAQYKGSLMSNSLKVVGVDLTSAGDIDVEGKKESVVFSDEDSYRKIVLDNGKIVGFIFFGLTKGIKECQDALEKGRDVTSWVGKMAEKDFDFAFPA
ncbi:MAG: FAD-dependent oxidoreductase [Pseudomonadota bacterium]